MPGATRRVLWKEPVTRLHPRHGPRAAATARGNMDVPLDVVACRSFPNAARSAIDFDASALRVVARGSKHAAPAHRPLALAAVYDGATRTEAARIGGVTLQIVRDWVMKFNAAGRDGLIDCKAQTSHPAERHASCGADDDARDRADRHILSLASSTSPKSSIGSRASGHNQSFGIQ